MSAGYPWNAKTTGLSLVNNGIEVAVGQSVRMLRRRLELEQIDDVDEPDLQIRELLPQKGGCGQRFRRDHIPCARDDDIGLDVLIRAGPRPDPDALFAVPDGRVEIQILQMELFVGDDDVHVVDASQAVIGHAQQTVRVGREIDAGDDRALVRDDIEEAGILMRKAVVILPPHGRRHQQIQ